MGCLLSATDPIESAVLPTVDTESGPNVTTHALEPLMEREGVTEDSQYAQSCAVRGYHHWLCDTAGPDDNFRTLMHQECMTCHMEEWTRNRGVHRRKATRPFNRARVASVPSAVPAVPRVTDGSQPKFDLLLDALSYIGAGGWDQFRSLAGSLSDDGLFPWRAARVLSSVGDIDLEMDKETFRIRSWQIAPPCLVEVSDGAWVLAGARSTAMVGRLRTAVLAIGATLSVHITDEGLSVVRLTSPSRSALADATRDLATPTGAKLGIAPRFAERLARLLPALSSLTASLVELRLGARGLERYDLGAGRWAPAEHDAPGAYRVEFRGRTYGVSSVEDLGRQSMRVTDAFLAKHLAAAQARLSLTRYDVRRRVLMAPLGAELPGVLDRLAAMSSGYPPQRQAGAAVIEYSGVPSDIAAAIQRCLRT
jgi:hypothetical protein